MSNDPQEGEWRERFWRGKPDASTEKSVRERLAAHPQAQADLDAELALTDAIQRLPDTPMPSNFTARVLRAARAEDNKGRPVDAGFPGVWRRFRWAFRLAAACVVTLASIFYYQHAEAARRANIARSVLIVSEVPSRPSTEVLENLDAIERLTPAVAADDELIALLK